VIEIKKLGQDMKVPVFRRVGEENFRN